MVDPLHERPILAALAGALAISFSGILFRVAHVSPSTGAVLRCLYALPILWPLAWLEKRRYGPRPLRQRALAWLAGVPWDEAQAAGSLLGTKTVVNELVAYVEMSKMGALSDRARLLMTYALCGFANFGSLGIMIGGLGTMCPERRAEVVQLGLKTIVSGTLATCLVAAIVGLIV